nr:uroporphyrinogen-III C-methyltransferase [uncultured Carboxylicivirga sp.]
MYEIILKSYEPVSQSILSEIEFALPDSAVIQLNHANPKKQLGTEELMMLCMGDVDLALVKWNKIATKLPDEFKIQAILNNGDDDPLVLISLKENQLDFWKIDQRRFYGKVYIAGFGPGNPELLTLKAHRLLQQADSIFFDDLIDHTYLDQFKAEKVYVGKRKGKHSALQGDINELLYKAAVRGKTVVRIKGGDPLIFGRGGEEFRYLQKRFVEAEIIPGVTAALAASADGVIPLTCRGVSTSVAFALGHDAINNKLPKADTLVFYMGAGQQQKWAQRLINEKWPANVPVAVVRNASLPDKEIKRYTLGQLQRAENVLPAPSVVIVGHTATDDVNKLGQNWLYTGTNVNDYKGGGRVVHNPMLAIRSVEPTQCQIDLINNLHSFDRLVFATPFAVSEFFKTLNQLGYDARYLSSIKISSVGPASSQKLKEYGINECPVSDKYTTEAVLKAFDEIGVKGERIVLPSSTQRLENLPEGLRLLGNRVKELCLYDNIVPESTVRHNLDEFTGVVFTSPTTVRHFFDFYGYFPDHLIPVCKSKSVDKVFKELAYGVLAS